MTLYEKKLKKIRLSLEKYALKGKDNYIEFHKYVDDLVLKGDYNAFIEVLNTYYNFTTTTRSVDELKKLAWKEVCFQTNAPFLKKLKRIYDDKKVYQNSFDIYSTNLDNINLYVSNGLSHTFSTTTATPSFILNKEDNGSVSLVTIRDNLYSFKLYTSNWVPDDGKLIPTREVEYMSVLVTQSETKTEITLDSVRQWWIYTEERQNLLKGLTYSNTMSSSTSVSNFSWSTDPLAVGYVLNISTYSTFEKTLRNYTSLRFGTVSGGDYTVSGKTASLTLYDLDSSQNHYFTIRNTIATYINSVTITGTTASFGFPTNPTASAYSLDVSTYSTFDYILPGYNFILGTISTTSSYTTEGAINRYLVNGLTPGTYHYKVRILYGSTQSGLFISGNSTGVANWPIKDFATNYKFEVSKSSTFSSILQSLKLGTQSGGNLTIDGNTASLIVESLGSDDLYYYRVNYFKGTNRILNYLVDMNRTTYLGQIYEREIFTQDVKYYLLNKQFANFIGARKTFLEVYKLDPLSSSGYATASIFAYDDNGLTEEQNLLIRYSQAIDFLNY